MTQKEYKLVAGALKQCKPSNTIGFSQNQYKVLLHCWQTTVRTVARELGDASPKFRFIPFFDEAGYPEAFPTGGRTW